MAGKVRVVGLGPLMGANSSRVTDRALQGTYMRGSYNVGLRDNEWWTRKGQRLLKARIASSDWWWAFDINSELSVIANPYWALAYDSLGFSALYTPAVTESITFTNGSATATTTSLRVRGQLIVADVTSGTGFSSEVYEVTAAAGVGPFTVTLDRVYEGTSGAKTRSFIDPLARNLAGTATNTTDVDRVGSCVVFEQLVSHTAASIHAANPATTAGRSYLIITSDRGVPVAIDLTAYLSGTRVGVLRTWFYNTALGTPAQIGADSALNASNNPRGIYAEVYKNRLMIGYATDPNGLYGDRTIWYSQRGDFLLWHTGIAGQTAAPNFVTFDGEGNEIAEMKCLGDDLTVHRWFSRETLSATQSLQSPFSRRSDFTRLGILDKRGITNRCVVANGLHWIWTPQGPAVWDGSQVRLVARKAYRDLLATEQIDGTSAVVCGLHDERERQIIWVLDTGSSERHQDALPASTATYSTVLIHQYDTDEAWLEDHPDIVGGGMMTNHHASIGSDVQQLLVFRPDGSLLEFRGRTTAKDADVTDPENGTADTVNAQVETGWLDFGTLERKTLTRIDLILRSISSYNQNWDRNSDLSSGNYWINCQVYTDYDESTVRYTQGRVYDSTSARLTQFGENRQAVSFPLLLSPRVHGRVFKLRFSNALTSAATSAGHVQAPFRISDIFCEVIDTESTVPLTELGGAAITE